MPPPNYGAVTIQLDEVEQDNASERSCAARLFPQACLALSPGYGPSWRWMVPLACCFLNECICLSMLYPFLGYMVWDFGIVENKDDAGMYAGYIASMFTFGQLLTGSLWGRASDRFGRCVAVASTGVSDGELLQALGHLHRAVCNDAARSSVRLVTKFISSHGRAFCHGYDEWQCCSCEGIYW